MPKVVPAPPGEAAFMIDRWRKDGNQPPAISLWGEDIAVIAACKLVCRHVVTGLNGG